MADGVANGQRSAGDVLNDIGSMLSDLTDELDAMLHMERDPLKNWKLLREFLNYIVTVELKSYRYKYFWKHNYIIEIN